MVEEAILKVCRNVCAGMGTSHWGSKGQLTLVLNKLSFSSDSNWRTPYGKFETQKLGVDPFVENSPCKGRVPTDIVNTGPY